MSCELLFNDDHSKTIIHIDLDCFYAQVEMIKNPKLRDVPLGIQQKNIVVTSNYIARQYSIKKCMCVSEAKKLCPELVLVKGEDLHDYRMTSTKVTTYLQKFSVFVEKLGLDENFIDVSDLVQKRIDGEKISIGNIYGSDKEECECGCFERLNIGSVIAAEIRNGLKDELNLTCCAGIAHNKLLAKLVGTINKPNQQTIVYPSNASQLLVSLPNVRSIPGIGTYASDVLKTLDIKTVEELRYCPMEKLQSAFGSDKAKLYMNLCYGKDSSAVKPSGRPQSIGLEDSCNPIDFEEEARDKFHQLLNRLMILVAEDGRIPRTLKVTVRKFDTKQKTTHREQRQCNISPTLFTLNKTVQLTHSATDKVMSLIMQLFHKLVDINKPFNVTLLGLAFTKFQERQFGRHSIASFLIKNLSVQSVTSLQSARNPGSSCTPMEYSPVSDMSSEVNTDGSESEVEPSPKKSKFDAMIAKKRCLDNDVECSPSKLRVAELRLNSRDTDYSSADEINICPGNIDRDVFKELPPDVQKELLDQWKTERKSTIRPAAKTKHNTLLKYVIKKP